MVKQIRTGAIQQNRRDAWVEIDLNALEQNARAIRRWVPSSVSLMAILKADGYGHGAVMMIPTLEASGVTMVGVASMDEALQIRDAGLKIPILVLGAIPDWAVPLAIEHNIQLTIFAENHRQSIVQGLKALKAGHRKTAPVQVHIKVDTGMHRIGAPWPEASGFIEQCHQTEGIEVKGVFTHLACAEDLQVTAQQWQRFQTVLSELTFQPQWVHAANSEGSLGYQWDVDVSFSQKIPAINLSRLNLSRIGIGFLGYQGHAMAKKSETRDFHGLLLREGRPSLKPVMGLKARVVHLQDVAPGEGVSYGYSYRNQTDGPRRIATLPLGYSDGVLRGLSNQMECLIRGVRVPQVGNITMDQMMIDVTGVSDVVVGETVTLLGQSLLGQALPSQSLEPLPDEKITLSDWAAKLNTIEYELMCALRVRLPKVYTRL